MRRPHNEGVPYLPVSSQPCSLGEIIIYHDTGRLNGYWYALVPVRVSGESETAMEVNLNGGGRSKARAKIERELRARGYSNFEVIIAKDVVERLQKEW